MGAEQGSWKGVVFANRKKEVVDFSHMFLHIRFPV